MSYYKQGDDLTSCLVKGTDDIINISATLDRHIALLQSAVYQLNDIKKVYMKMELELDLGGQVRFASDGHFIGITGPDDFINCLIKEELVERDPFESEDESDEDIKLSDIKVQEVMKNLFNKTVHEDDGSESEPDHGIGSEIVGRSMTHNIVVNL